MKYNIYYNGNSRKYLKDEILDTREAETKREAVEAFYADYLDYNYIPDEEGNILDCAGNLIADENDDSIEFDGGSFYAEKDEDETGRDERPIQTDEEGYVLED